ncbi:hypothetical protein GCM10010399_34980 [Dactylosporangium fulvum]
MTAPEHRTVSVTHGPARDRSQTWAPTGNVRRREQRVEMARRCTVRTEPIRAIARDTGMSGWPVVVTRSQPIIECRS